MKRMRALKEVIFFSLFLFFAFPFSAMAGKKEALRLEKINSDLKQLTEDISFIKSEEEANLKRLELIEKKIEQQNILLNRLQKGLQKTVSEKEELQKDEKGLNKVINSHKKALSKRLREVYKTSSVSELELLFSTGSLKDFLKNRTYLKVLALKDKEQIEKLYQLRDKKRELQKAFVK